MRAEWCQTPFDARRRRRPARLAAAVLALAGLVAACTGDSDDPDDPGAVDVPSEPVDGGTLRIGLGGPVLIDPLDASLASASDLMVLDLLHDGLARLSADGTPQPALAASWAPSAARDSWEFTISSEATFSDGEPITATDVVASLERVAAAGTGSLAALRLEQIAGFSALVDGSADHLSGLTAPDPATVRIELISPMSILPQLLASPVFGIVDVAAMEAVGEEGADLSELALSGAWEPASFDDGVLLLDRRGDDGHLDAIELTEHDDVEAAYEAFEDGDVDWAAVPADEVESAVERHGDEHFAPFHAVVYFGLNVDAPALGSIELRRAIAAAIDREAIVEAVYADVADPLPVIVPAGLGGHSGRGCEACGYDPDRAEELLAEAFPDGDLPEVHVDFDDSADQTEMAELVVEQLEAVGIPATPRPRSIEDYERFVVSGEQELFSFGWIGVYASPDAYLATQFAGDAPDNVTGFASPVVDKLLAAARSAEAPAGRLAAWADAEHAVLEAAVVVPILQFRTQVVAADRVQGLTHAIDGSVDWRDVWLADASAS